MPFASASYLSSVASAWPCASRRVFSASASAAMVIFCLLDLLLHDFDGREALQLRFRLRLLNLGLRIELRHLAALRRLRRLHREFGVRGRDQRTRAVLARDRVGLLALHEDALLRLGLLLTLYRGGFVLRHPDLQVAVGFGLANGRQRFLLLHVDALVGLGLLLALLGLGQVLRHLDGALANLFGLTHRALAILVGDVDLGLVDGLGRRLLADALDVSRLVRDVGDVHVDEIQADLVELGCHVAADRIQEFLAILVDLLDGQRRHRQSQLAKDDFARHALDRILVEVEHALGRVVHDGFFGADAHRERARHVDANVLQ